MAGIRAIHQAERQQRMVNATDVQPCLHERILVSSEHALNERITRILAQTERSHNGVWGNDPSPVIDDEGDHVTVLRVRLPIFERKDSASMSLLFQRALVCYNLSVCMVDVPRADQSVPKPQRLRQSGFCVQIHLEIFSASLAPMCFFLGVWLDEDSSGDRMMAQVCCNGSKVCFAPTACRMNLLRDTSKVEPTEGGAVIDFCGHLLQQLPLLSLDMVQEPCSRGRSTTLNREGNQGGVEYFDVIECMVFF